MSSSSGPSFDPHHLQKTPQSSQNPSEAGSKFADVKKNANVNHEELQNMATSGINTESTPSGISSSNDDISNSPSAQMFPAGASKEDLKKFINTFLNMMVYQVKRDGEKMHKAALKLKKVAEGEDPDE